MSVKLPVAERDILKACLDYLTLRRIPAWRSNTGATVAEYKGRKRLIRYGVKGHGDIAGILPGGRALFIETKRPGKQPTEAQEAFLANVRAVGGVALVVHSLDELIAGLESEGVI